VGVPASDLTRSAVVSLLTFCLATGLAVAVNFATAEGAGVMPWIAVVALTMLSAVLAIVVHPRRKPAPPPEYGGYGPPPGYGPAGHGRPPGYGQQYPGGPPPHGQRPGQPPGPVPPRRTVSLLTVVLVIALITGLTGGLAYGGWYVTGWVIGTESGPDVLVRPVSQTEGPLTVTVQRVEVTGHLTKVGVTAVNSGKDSITLPLFGNCQLDAGGATMGADPFRSRWNQAVPAGGRTVGTILFGSRPAEGARTASLSFAHTFGSFELNSITVRDIELSTGT
jgi:hypothetical protein